MPARDRYHDNVVHALQKEGWDVTDEQVLLIVGKRYVWTDIQAEKDGQTIYVEVKGFETRYSIIEYLASTVGQYVMYSASIEYLQLDILLYLAVPNHAFYGILSETLGQQVMKKANIRLLVFNPIAEEVTQWQI